MFLLIFSPLNFLNLAYNLIRETASLEYIDIIVTVFLIYGTLAPLVLSVIKKGMATARIREKMKLTSPDQAWFKFSLVQSAVGVSIFVYGFFAYLLSGDIEKMLYFYPIGIVWAFFLWPTRNRYEDFISKIEEQWKT